MDAWDLKVFETVARHLGMNRAALELDTVQSNVTARIRLLETELGTSLFERNAKGLKLTPAGARLVPHAINVRAAIENAKRAVKDDGVPKGPLMIGSMPAAAALHVTPLLSSYAALYPEVDVSLGVETATSLIGQVLAREIEGAFVCGPVEHSDLVSEPIYMEELAIFSAPALADLRKISPESTKLIVSGKGCAYRKLLETHLYKRGLTGFRVLEFGTLEAIHGCVTAGLGITLLPKALFGALWREDSIRAHLLPEEESMGETVFIRRRDGFLSSALATFLNSVRTAKLAPSAPVPRPSRKQRPALSA